MWLLVIDPTSSGRVASVLKHGAVSPAVSDRFLKMEPLQSPHSY